MFRLICLPLGETVFDEFVKEASANPEKSIIITLSSFVEEKAKRLQARAENFDYLASRVLQQCGLFNVRLLGRGAEEMVIRDILAAKSSLGELPFFEKLADKEGFIQSVASLIGQIARSGASVEEVENVFATWTGESDAPRPKDAEISGIYAAYRAHLELNDAYDVEGLYRLAEYALSQKEDEMKAGSFHLRWDRVYFLGYPNFTMLQMGIIRELSRFCEVTVALCYDLKRPGIYRSGDLSYLHLARLKDEVPGSEIELKHDMAPRIGALAHILKNFRAEGETKPYSLRDDKAAEQPVRIWEMEDSDSQMRVVLRDIKERIVSGTDPARICVTVRQMSDYANFYALCEEYGIPCDLPKTVALSATPLFEYVTGFLESRFGHGREQTESMLHFLSLGLNRTCGLTDIHKVRYITDRWYYTDVEKLLDRLGQDVPDKKAFDKVRAIWMQVPQSASLGLFGDCVRQLLEENGFKKRAGELYRSKKIGLDAFKTLALGEDALLKILRDMVHEYSICGYEKRSIGLDDFIKILREKAENTDLRLASSDKEGIRVLPATRMQETDFDHVYILGLREGEFPYVKNEDWIYDDKERAVLASLGLELGSSAASLDEDVYFFTASCAAAQKTLVFTYHRDDDHEASSYIDEIRSLFTDLEIEEKKLPEDPASALSARALKRALALDGRREDLKTLATGLSPHVFDEAQKEGGIISDPVLLERVKSEITDRFSASKLETYASCPFAFMARYVWGEPFFLEQVEETVNAVTKGNLNHEVLERFIAAHLGESLADQDRAKLEQQLRQIFEECCEAKLEAGSISSGVFWPYEKADIWRHLTAWLKNELRYSARWPMRPSATEFAFGKDGAPDVRIETGRHGIDLNGSIDRMDEKDGVIFVTDYKTGKTPEAGDFLDTNLQMPVYFLAAKKLMPQKDIAGGGYYLIKTGERKCDFLFEKYQDLDPSPPRKKGNTSGPQKEMPSYAEFETRCLARLDELLDGMEKGQFAPKSSDECKYCAAKMVCRVKKEDGGEENGEV